MGTIDGANNSRRQATIDRRCDNAWHHTNTETLFHLPVTRTMRVSATISTETMDSGTRFARPE
jgi:hypothetical protein